jgi:ectoine hydroxylase-related dioxygenase (phytanoyl-CoA dioxygenase family)
MQAFLEENGYLVIPNAVSKEQCERMTEEFYDRAERLMGVTRSNPASWNVCLSARL